MQKIILASGSKQRKLIMDALHIPYEIIPADIDEKAIEDPDPLIRPQKIARAKAEKVAAEHTGIIIAGDSYAILNGKRYEKPVDLDDARRMMKEISGGTGILYAGFVYLDKENDIDFSTTVTCDFTLREFSDAEIEENLKKLPVTTWSGGVSPAYHYGMTMVEKINGSLTAFTHGFPADVLIPLLRKSGFDVKP